MGTLFIRHALIAVCYLILPLLAIGCAPKTFQKTPPGWKTIELRPGLVSNYPAAWQTTVDTIAMDHDIEMLDKASGYLRTTWKYGISGQKSEVYRGRIIVKYPNVDQPEKMELKTEAEWSQGQGWLRGWDSAFQRDVYNALAGRLGRTAPSE